MLRPAANEIHELIEKLASRKRACVDAARARLSIIGGRAVEDLIEALEGDDDRVRARVMPLLALIQDPRGREPLAAMLLDRSARLRGIAAQSLARFPSRDTVAALNRLLDGERSARVRVAATHALVEQYAAGQENAIGRVVELLTDPRQPQNVRVACLSLAPLIPPTERRSLLKRLKTDEDAELRERAQELDNAGQRGSDGEHSDAGQQTEALLQALASNDYAVWNRSVHRLAASGKAAIPAILTEMQSRAHDPEFCTRAGMALKAMGPRRGQALAAALEEIHEPLPLQVLVDVVGAFGEKSLIYRLKDLIDRLDGRTGTEADSDGLDLMRRVRAKAHLELARIGSRVAVEDLCNALADEERRVEIEMLAAMELIGKREEIGVLLRAHAREDEFIRERIAEVVRAIMKRERIRRNNRIFQSLSPRQRSAWESIMRRHGLKRRRRDKGRATL